jgi:pimeloyl-ACP methyl ester carboxylesterase
MRASARPRADATITLAGRTLAYCEWGNPTGFPVMLMHGGPGSRLLCPDEDATAAAEVRLLTVDRPGYGGSDRRPDPTPLGWADDVQALADRLGLERFAVVGFSAGGGYALACAARMPERISAVGGRGPAREWAGWWTLDRPQPALGVPPRRPQDAGRCLARRAGPPGRARARPLLLGRAAQPDAGAVPTRRHLLLLQHWDEILAAVTARAETKDPAAGRQERDWA